jgi:hypothetical protein
MHNPDGGSTIDAALDRQAVRTQKKEAAIAPDEKKPPPGGV